MEDDKDTVVINNEEPRDGKSNKTLLFIIILAILFLGIIAYLVSARSQRSGTVVNNSPTPTIEIFEEVEDEESMENDETMEALLTTPTSIVVSTATPTSTKAPTPTFEGPGGFQNPQNSPTNTPKPTSMPLSF